MELEKMSEIFVGDYNSQARKALKNEVLQGALADLQGRFGRGTAIAYQNLPEGPDLRLKAHDIREKAIDNLDVLLETLAANVRKNGGHVFFAQTSQAALAYCLATARKHNVKLAVKGKSMVSEEIGLNSALLANGIDVAETDLGEYIIQLAGERPSHIIAPAIHKTRKDIGRLFTDKIGIPYTDDPPSLTRAARKSLRQKFLAADMGFSGCNIACAETGHILTVSNEGNIRMSTTMPRVHVAIMGMERVAARLEDHDILLRLLCRGAAAQNMGTYASYVGGPRYADQVDGPDEFHLTTAAAASWPIRNFGKCCTASAVPPA
jgi:L-lactate dehydrogenase complex protein LldF